MSVHLVVHGGSGSCLRQAASGVPGGSAGIWYGALGRRVLTPRKEADVVCTLEIDFLECASRAVGARVRTMEAPEIPGGRRMYKCFAVLRRC
eukprot:CAMPEP_0117667148 /NCGR_PEP_ID=MMETSP0804-20121206/10792_1 /TAXON_ID=1074897 /ORGANISM="Tetraselmis astigmatica, Strain CCMP880" /LENGTH=91 /DNA_ID=CAMNT_0005474815 /DNA_START=782 /DNA_END=1057 /DNA_ORIENTATION=+